MNAVSLSNKCGCMLPCTEAQRLLCTSPCACRQQVLLLATQRLALVHPDLAMWVMVLAYAALLCRGWAHILRVQQLTVPRTQGQHVKQICGHAQQVNARAP